MGKIGFIGTGRMGSALIRGIAGARSHGTSELVAFDKDEERLANLKGAGVPATPSLAQLLVECDTIFLCVKPQDVDAVLEEIKQHADGKLFVSIAAGVKTSKIEEALPGARVIRVMPNTPAVVGLLAAGYALGVTATSEDAALVEKLLSPLGVIIKVEKDLMDAVTGLSGSGPAYTYYVIKALADAGVAEGLKESEALELAAQTVKGAAEMILAGEGKPQELIDAVCSPGGTTVEGLKVLEERGVAESLKEAVKAASEKSRKLAK